MPVTDLGDGLPWWLQGPGPTGAPTTQPQGSGGGAKNWLDYLYSMVNPISSAQAADDPQTAALRGALNAQANGQPQPQDPRLSGAGGLVPPSLAASLGRLGAGAPVGAGLPDQSGIRRMPNGVLATQPTPPPVGAGMPDLTGIPRTPNGVLATAPQPGAAGPGGGVDGPAPAAAPAGPLSSSGGASGMGATSNPRFTTVSYQDPNSVRNAPIYTALNLGGGGASNAPAAAAPSGGAAAPARVQGPLGARSNAPWGMGPTQKGMVFPSDMGPFTQDQLAARGLRQRYR